MAATLDWASYLVSGFHYEKKYKGIENNEMKIYVFIFIVTKKSSFFKLLEFFFYRKIKMKQNLHVLDCGERIIEYYAI